MMYLKANMWFPRSNRFDVCEFTRLRRHCHAYAHAWPPLLLPVIRLSSISSENF